MKDPYFFGYGSLVNRATHTYPDVHPVKIKGWHRHWRQTTVFHRAILTAVPDAESQISGLLARVPDDDWTALDEREHAYDRVDISDTASPLMDQSAQVAIYEIPNGKHPEPAVLHPIALSYLDVVVQGYLNEFGETGVADFFASTSGWEAPILNDRHAPLYPRAQILNTAEAQLVDRYISRLTT
ncbi:MAG: gamma-glutamylcyclotransferase family protein [Pseudoruegeria sp.]